jgi:hypothetical protein
MKNQRQFIFLSCEKIPGYFQWVCIPSVHIHRSTGAIMDMFAHQMRLHFLVVVVKKKVIVLKYIYDRTRRNIPL